jgi:ATPases with chaperone activity, ATP-binding subunit
MDKSNKFTKKAENSIKNAIDIARNLGHTYIGSEHILLGILSEKNSVAAAALDELGIVLNDLEALVRDEIGTGAVTTVSKEDFTPRMKKILKNAAIYAENSGKDSVGTQHILLSILEENDSYAMKLLGEMGLNKAEISRKLNGASIDEIFSQREMGNFGGMIFPRFNKAQPKEKSSYLEKYGKNLTKEAQDGNIDPVIGRGKEIERVIQILSRRTKNNPCLIGEPGVGKTAILEGLAIKIANDSVPDSIKGKQIISLDLTSMIAGTKYRGDFEERIKATLDEVKKNKNVILFLDEIHTIVGSGSAEGSADAANILKPSLTKGELRLIGATTIKEYRKNIEKDPALERRFQPVMVEEPSEEEAVKILKGLKEKYESFHRIEITDTAIDAAVKLASRYIADRFLPDKAIDLIDEAASRLKINTYTVPEKISNLEKRISALAKDKESAVNSQDFELAARIRDMEKKLILELSEEKLKWKEKSGKVQKRICVSEIANIVSEWTGIPVTQLTSEETERLLNLENILHERVIGQDKAVSAVARAIKRGRTGVKDPNRPIGSFIFLGPTGVGKTELCKALAEAVFGTENALIRFDMSEFMEKYTSSKLIGSPPGYIGYGEGGQLTEKVRQKPYSVILFDEIEKADPEIFNILLQILEDGHLTDSQGRKVNFKNAVIIMTSNIGAKFITDKGVLLGFSQLNAKEGDEKAINDRVMKEIKNVFKPELLNRVDETIVFKRLSKEDIKLITKSMLNTLIKHLKSINISVTFSEVAVNKLAEKGFDDAYGARPLRRVIQNEIEDKISEQILEKKIKKGDKLFCDFLEKKFVFQKPSSQS